MTPLQINLEAEQALLGALLNDAGAYDRLPDVLRAEHFATAAHQELFHQIGQICMAGSTPQPALIAPRFKGHLDLGDVKPLDWLIDLMTAGCHPSLANQTARQIYDLAIRRGIVSLAGDMEANVADHDRTAKELIEDAENALYGLAETGVKSASLVTFDEALDGAIAHIQAAYKRDGALSGLATDLVDLDYKIGGMHPSDLLILAGRPSMGKTALATNIAFNVARNYRWEPDPDGPMGRRTVRGGVVAFYSLEMSKEQLAARILSDVSGVSGDRLRKGEITEAEFRAICDARAEIAAAPLFIDETGGLHIGKLASRARRQKRRTGLDLIVVDYLQLLTTDKGKGGNRVQEVSEITGALKALAKELNVPVLALSQLSRQVENRDDKRPQLSDLRESGSIEQDADAVMFVYRESYYLARTEPRPGSADHHTWLDQMQAVQGQAEVVIGKQRHGPIGIVKLAFDENTTRFGNLAREDGEPHYRQPYGDA